MYLNFVETEHFVEHLKAHNVNKIHVDIEYYSGNPKGEFSIYSVTYYALMTARIDDYIAQAFTLIAQATSVELSIDQELREIRRKMFGRFEEVVADLTAQGFEVERGVWSTQPHKLFSK